MQAKIMTKFLFLTVFLSATLFAQSNTASLDELRSNWAIANYELTGDAQIKAYEALIVQANAAVAQHPDSAELLVWNGIIKSAFAGVKGGLGALAYAKEAKKSLEASLDINDKVLDGSAYASLGTLYSNVPGWPLGFGSDKKAVQLLQKALEINPDGIDPNYFYADHLLRKKEYEAAERYLIKAQQAAPRADQLVADAGRQQMILTALAEVRQELQHSGS
jgi:tetratricopeptide (TPR) repeat protein